MKPAVEEALRWQPNLPMFSRWVTRDVDFHGVRIPEGAIVHLGIGPANRDPARWERPDDYDPTRPMKPSLAFGSGPHVCLGMHVARAEMTVGLNALLDRLPNLRLDPDAEPPRDHGHVRARARPRSRSCSADLPAGPSSGSVMRVNRARRCRASRGG